AVHQRVTERHERVQRALLKTDHDVLRQLMEPVHRVRCRRRGKKVRSDSKNGHCHILATSSTTELFKTDPPLRRKPLFAEKGRTDASRFAPPTSSQQRRS